MARPDGVASIDRAPIQLLLERIIARWRPEQIWLFGSRAKGTASSASDWDLLVVVPDDLGDAELDPVIGWRLQRSSGVRADVIPCRASEFVEARTTPNTLAFEAVASGVLIHER
jgi:predicted nucleotidyltransferase